MKHRNWINVLIMVGLLVSTGVLSPAALRPARAEVTSTIWHVINEATGGCSSWIDACSLYVAVTTAVPDTEIWVAEGTYTYSGDRDVSIEMESGVALYGGFEGTETSRDQRNPDPTTNSTVLSGDIGVVGNNSDNRYHVVIASGTDSTAVLDGFTITAGNADGTDPYDRGGGMYINSGSPTLRNLTFSGNLASFGGGLANVNSSPTMTNVTFCYNSANHRGGGLSNLSSSPILTDVTFISNSAMYLGGGMMDYGSSPLLTNVTFSGNSAHDGGGIYDAFSSPSLTNVTFTGNSAEYGGGMANSDNSSPSVRNSILWNNQDSSGTGTLAANITNSSSIITLTHSLVQGSGGSDSWTSDTSYVDGGNNLDSDPLFVLDVDPSTAPTTSGDLRLGVGSPAINAGDNQYVTGVPTDLDGALRISGGTVDMGAYEFQFFYTLTVSLAGSGDGLVSSDPTGIDCGTVCNESYTDGTVVTLTGAANTGSSFAGWSGACTNTSGDCVVTMSEAKSVTASFTLNIYLLSVSLAGDGNGSVSSDPTGIDCGSDCSESYDYGTLVTLTASAGTDTKFAGWSGDCTNPSGNCVVTMDAGMAVVATFEVSGPAEVFLPLIQQNH